MRAAGIVGGSFPDAVGAGGVRGGRGARRAGGGGRQQRALRRPRLLPRARHAGVRRGVRAARQLLARGSAAAARPG